MKNRNAVLVVVFCVVVLQEVLAQLSNDNLGDVEVPPKSKSNPKKSEVGGSMMDMLIGPLLKMFFRGGGGGGAASGGLGDDGSNKGKDDNDDDAFGDLFGTMMTMFLG